MKSFTAAVTLASILPAIMSLTINTPSSVVQCQPQLLTWSDGASPYYLSVIPGGQASAMPLKTFDTQTGNSLTWKVDQKAGTLITLSVKDATGAVAYSDVVTVQQGPDTSCLNGAAPAASPSPQDASVNTASVPTSASVISSSVSLQTGTIRPNSISSGVIASPSRAASVTSGSSSATQSTSRTVTSTSARTATTNSSGAKSSLGGHGYGFVGALGLIGALFL